ncbi:MAG: amidohydrolase family protein [Actinophytocola sp.]|uniref:amidohydrolase family protein n=1 Tax=Actinophytocola sp. TaxID=1872138 RepID=UPI00132919BA|nr:amidohydrolase family protein [Actinophytocola sp.]MPZ85779.1 amidohydrolase family protein [Actinophytocola sp.]
MVVIDAQAHIWAAETPQRPWVPNGAKYAHRPVPLGAGELLSEMDQAGVDRALLVSPTWEGYRNDVVLEAATTHPDRFRVVVRLAPTRPDLREALVESWSDPRVLGVRTAFVRDEEPLLTDGTAERFWAIAAEVGIPVLVFAPGNLDLVERAAERHPGLSMIVDHLGVDPRARDRDLAGSIAAVVRLARLHNVAVKATGVPTMVTEPYPFPSLHDHVHRVVDAFGPERVFWGTDLSRLRCAYGQVWTLLFDELTFLSDKEKALLAGDAMAGWLGWPAENAGGEPP